MYESVLLSLVYSSPCGSRTECIYVCVSTCIAGVSGLRFYICIYIRSQHAGMRLSAVFGARCCRQCGRSSLTQLRTSPVRATVTYAVTYIPLLLLVRWSLAYAVAPSFLVYSTSGVRCCFSFMGVTYAVTYLSFTFYCVRFSLAHAVAASFLVHFYLWCTMLLRFDV